MSLAGREAYLVFGRCVPDGISYDAFWGLSRRLWGRELGKLGDCGAREHTRLWAELCWGGCETAIRGEQGEAEGQETSPVPGDGAAGQSRCSDSSQVGQGGTSVWNLEDD